MNIRPKTVRRLAILAAGVVLIVGGLAAVAIVHRNNKNKRLLAARDFGLAAFNAGDWPLALDRLGPYKDAHPEDYEALYAFAVARSRVPAGNGQHLGQAKQLFEQLHHARPGDKRASLALLDLYLQFGYYRETIELADVILTADAGNVDALRAKARSLQRTAKLDDALAVSLKLNDVAPLDLAGHTLTYELMRQMGKPVADVSARYDALRKAHPNDPRFEMLSALASDYANDRLGAINWLRAAAARPAPDPAFVEQLARMFDDLKLFAESQSLLERAVAASAKNDSSILSILVQRLWQNGRFADVVQRLSDMDTASPAASADLLAFKAMALRELGKPDQIEQSDQLIKTLTARKSDVAAQQWAMALRTRYDAQVDPRSSIGRYEQALARGRDNAIIRMWMGEAYQRLGETQLALLQYRKAAGLMSSWSRPYEAMSAALLVEGREAAALEAARAAARRAPSQPSVVINLALAWNAYYQANPLSGDAPRLLEFVSDIQRQIPGEPQSLPIYVELSARNGHADQAAEAVRAALQRPAPPETLLRLLAVCRANNLPAELQSQLRERVGARESASPTFALSSAVELARAGKAAEGLDLLTKAAASSTTQPAQWQLAVARYRDMAADPSAKDAWIALGDANPGDVYIQTTILTNARAARSDRDFIARTIERTRKLTGDEAQLWRFAKARWLLGAPPGKDHARDGAEAVGILSDLVRASPDVPQYRERLAAGLMNLGNVKDAVDHLKTAADLDPDDIATVLELARMLQGQSRFDESLQCLVRASKGENLTPQNRLTLARLMAQQGAVRAAFEALKPAHNANQLDVAGMLLFAELARSRGMNEQAADAYAKVLADPAATAEALTSAADFLASRGKLADARAALERMKDLRVPAWQQIMLKARFAEAHEGVAPDEVREQFAQATRLAPREPVAWRALAEFEMRQLNWDAAVAAAETALALKPADPELADLKMRATILRAAGDEKADLSPLIQTLDQDPVTAAQADLLRAVQLARSAPATRPSSASASVITQIRALADKHPTNFQLQRILAMQYVAARQFDDAAKIAERLLQARPTDPAPAELATGVYQAAARWRDMKRSADIWRERTPIDPSAADIAAGQALLNLRDAKGAMDRFAPYLAQVRTNPAGNPPLTSMVLRAMIGAGHAADARELLQPLLAKAGAWRELWLNLAATELDNAVAASEWIKLVAPLIPSDATHEQLALARAWQQVDARFHDPAARDAATQVLQQLADRADPDPTALIMLASLKFQSGDLASAESLYRRALKARPDLPEAQNNLAFLLLRRGGDLTEAKDLAISATTAAPSIADFHDTLARIYVKLGAKDKAIASFETALKHDPHNLQAMVGLANVLSGDGNRQKAADLLRRIEALLPAAPAPSESLKLELQNLREQLSRAG